ncbi:hypothetical protein OIU79_020606 [Salix purpurea]|uniref:Uncharacterized protein n=1 Tax=Salix purpurea TaxID=77065 RepID=A0A9Q0WNR3_SALPP|nr:hypothetical protein OIU79_020606 [Salix purpurea]
MIHGVGDFYYTHSLSFNCLQVLHFFVFVPSCPKPLQSIPCSSFCCFHWKAKAHQRSILELIPAICESFHHFLNFSVMGCCVSTDNDEPSKLKKQQHFQAGSESLKQTKSPPPSLYQEETVKEVLSETPRPKPPQNPVKTPHQETDLQQPEVHKKERIHIDPSFLDEIKVHENKFKNREKISREEVHHQGQIFEQDESDVWSLSYSESISTTTTMTNNNDRRDYCDDESEVKQRVSRSPLPPRKQVSGELGPRKDRVVGRSPTRRTTEQSPSKRNGAVKRGPVRAVQGREMGSGQVGSRRVLRPDLNRRDPGEASARRSRSPATNRSLMGRSPSTKRTNQSPGRVRKDPNESGGGNGEKDNDMEAKAASH